MSQPIDDDAWAVIALPLPSAWPKPCRRMLRRHVNSIMGKLQVQSRLEAVAPARELEMV